MTNSPAMAALAALRQRWPSPGWPSPGWLTAYWASRWWHDRWYRRQP